MAANDYIICEGCLGTIYLAKKTRPRKNGPQVMSLDRRPLTEGEQIGVFEHYLRRYCEDHSTDTVTITDADGKKIFEAKLLDIEERVESPVDESSNNTSDHKYVNPEWD